MTRGYIFDLDGTVYLGDTIIDGAADTINELRSRGDKIVFLTNKPIATRKAYVEKLNNLGIRATMQEIINSNFIMATYLKEELKEGQKVFVIGEAPLFEELLALDISITNDPLAADYVVLSWDRKFDYEKLNAAYQAWWNGAKILATNPDRTCPMADGQIPDCGAMIGALEGATGEKIDLIVGKPSKIMAQAAVERLGVDYPDCYMVGDRLETDIKMGIDVGMNSVLVLTGVTKREMLADSPYQPTHVLESIKEITRL